MSRIFPIRSLLSDYLQHKSVSRQMHKTPKDSFDILEKYSPSDGAEYCGAHQSPTTEFFLSVQQFYEDRNEFPTYAEYETYFAKRERIEIRNEYDEVVEIHKDKSDRAFPDRAYDNAMYQLLHPKPDTIDLTPAPEKAEPTLKRAEVQKVEWMLKEENRLYRELFTEHDEETRQHIALYEKQQQPQSGAKPSASVSTAFSKRAKDYERHCIEGTLESWLKHVETHREPLSFVYQNPNTTIHYNTPRLLLGRFYNESDIGDRKVYHQTKMRFVLCRFSDMLQLLKSVDFQDISRDIHQTATEIAKTIAQQNKKVNERVESNTLFGFPLVVLDSLDLLKHQMQYSVLWALLLRLWVAHREMETFQPTHRKHALRLQLFIDSHISLCQYIIRNRQFEDADLLDPQRNRDSIVMCAAQQYYPNDRDFAYAGNLPNLTECMFVGNLYYDVRPKPKTVALPHALIHIFACKTQPQKCQIRNFVNILYKYIQSFPMIGQLYREIIRVSLLGNYEHASVRPHFELRMQIYEESNPKNYNELEFFHWLLDNDKLVFQMTKEFHMFTVQSDMTVDNLMQENNPSWKRVKEIIRDSIDMCRLILRVDMLKRKCYGWRITRDTFLALKPDSFEETRDWRTLTKQVHSDTVSIETQQLFISIIQDQVVFMHNQAKQASCAKLKKGSYLDVIAAYTEGFFETRIVDQRSTIKHNSEMRFSARFLERINLIARYMVYKHSTGLLADGKVQIFYLKAFGISKPAYHLLCKIQYMYEHFDLPDNAVTKYLKWLYVNHELDFHLFHVFLRAITYHRMFRRHALPLDYYLSQRRAILAKRMKMPWEDMNPDDDLYHYCPSCKKFKNPVSDFMTNHSPKNMYTHGCENVIYDVFQNRLYCTKNSVPSSIKRAIDSGLYASNDRINDKQLAKMIRKHKETIPCCETQLVAVHMCGWIQQMEKRKWILCSVCAQPMIFETCKFGPLGVTCGLHDHLTSSEKQKQANYSSLSKQSLEYQLRLTRLPLPLERYSDFSKPETIDHFDYLKAQMAYARQRNHYLEHYRKNYCFYCKCSLTFKPFTKSTKNIPFDYANPISLIEDRPITKMNVHEFQDPLFDETSNNNNTSKSSLTVIDLEKEEPVAHRWTFTNAHEHPTQFRAINVYLCARDYKKIAYAMEDNYIRTTTQFFSEMQRINDYAMKRQQKIQSRAYGYPPR